MHKIYMMKGKINEYEEEDNEIIDNDDCFDDSLLKSKKSIDEKEITKQEKKMKIHYKEFEMK